MNPIADAYHNAIQLANYRDASRLNGVGGALGYFACFTREMA
jgi:hypothetical protein